MDKVFTMIDINDKRPTHRQAVAQGTIRLSQKAFKAVRDKTVKKGDVLALAEIAGIMGAKNTDQLIPLCHTLPLSSVVLHHSFNEADNSLTFIAHVQTLARTGVEMEALAAVQMALLSVWDLTKYIDPAMRIDNVELLIKTGGKRGFWKNPQGVPADIEALFVPKETLDGVKVAVMVMSDRAFSGEYADDSGAFLSQALTDQGATLLSYTLLPDDQEKIRNTLLSLCSQEPQLLILSGGTGPGLRDKTSETLAPLWTKRLEGLGNLLRQESLYTAPTAWLSNMEGGLIQKTLVVTFPGSLKAVRECFDIIAPVLPQALRKIQEQH